jgi:hypothetical protein
MARRRRNYVTRGLAIALLLIGCAGPKRQLYPGPPLPRDQVVILKQSSKSKVFAIDKMKVDGFKWELNPGTHEVEVSVLGEIGGGCCYDRAWSRPCVFHFDFAPGVTYRLEARGEAQFDSFVGVAGVYAVLINLDTGEPEPDATCGAD